jgi:hypothetical protein
MRRCADTGVARLVAEGFDDGRTDVPVGAAGTVERVVVVGVRIAGADGWPSRSTSLSVFISPALAHTLQDRLQNRTVKIGHRRSQNRTIRTAQASMIACQGADQRVWVELRGFEPLTPRCELLAPRSLAVVGAGRCSVAACRSRSRLLALLYFCAVRRSPYRRGVGRLLLIGPESDQRVGKLPCIGS